MKMSTRTITQHCVLQGEVGGIQVGDYIVPAPIGTAYVDRDLVRLYGILWSPYVAGRFGAPEALIRYSRRVAEDDGREWSWRDAVEEAECTDLADNHG